MKYLKPYNKQTHYYTEEDIQEFKSDINEICYDLTDPPDGEYHVRFKGDKGSDIFLPITIQLVRIDDKNVQWNEISEVVLRLIDYATQKGLEVRTYGARHYSVLKRIDVTDQNRQKFPPYKGVDHPYVSDFNKFKKFGNWSFYVEFRNDNWESKVAWGL